MKTKIGQAVERKASGKYNCAQAVACTYCGEAGMDEVVMRDVTNAFGVGMGNMEGTCGAIVGAGVVLGLRYGDRAKSMKAMKRIMNRFQHRNGSTVCKMLKGTENKCVLRECNDCVADAAEFLEEALEASERPQA
ncbi:MAG: C-GCAxxG-C-C family protein [Prevotella sp.]|jgi:C_GCAxxG_C_C family probable redox protein|uniref:C-GCAxxG-C-C family protein n=1 Tax=Prevotella sp. PTAC TaxID=2736295 RepID=UPI00155246C0|nr:C-GCAxxG-C-C family protein [Prevotella sp. PTAC]MCX4294018.1 C-GCAxxG-C-C family protein [Prevotella sp.]NPD53410.1 C_GCAxxG_C_C family protein [Prevotella sp. PTAC]